MRIPNFPTYVVPSIAVDFNSMTPVPPLLSMPSLHSNMHCCIYNIQQFCELHCAQHRKSESLQLAQLLLAVPMNLKSGCVCCQMLVGLRLGLGVDASSKRCRVPCPARVAGARRGGCCGWRHIHSLADGPAVRQIIAKSWLNVVWLNDHIGQLPIHQPTPASTANCTVVPQQPSRSRPCAHLSSRTMSEKAGRSNWFWAQQRRIRPV